MDAKRSELALPWFNRAAACEFSGLDSLRMQNQLRRAESLHSVGQDAEEAYTQALQIAKKSDDLGEFRYRPLPCREGHVAMDQWAKEVACLKTWE